MSEIPHCGCGMFSVGVCTTCREYACGIHGRLVGGKFLCEKDAEAEERAAREREARERAESAAKAPPPPRPQTLAEEVRSIADAQEASRQARINATESQEQRARAMAAELHPQLVELINEVLAMPGAASVSYDILGDLRGHKWGTKQVEDDRQIGTHVEDNISRGSNGWTPRSTYGGVWPAMAWLTGWTAPSGDFMGEPLLSSLWFNKFGMVVAGSTGSGYRQRRCYTKPEIDLYCITGAPSYSHRHGHPAPAKDLFGPINITELGVEHLVRVCLHAMDRPTLLRKSLARIVLGKSPETEYSGHG